MSSFFHDTEQELIKESNELNSLIDHVSYEMKANDPKRDYLIKEIVASISSLNDVKDDIERMLRVFNLRLKILK